MRESAGQPGDLPYPLQCSLPSACGWSGVGSPSQGHTGLGVIVTSIEVILQMQREYTFHNFYGFLMQNWTGMAEMMENALCLISPFLLFGRTVLNM